MTRAASIFSMHDGISRFRAWFMSLLGRRYRELPFGTRREHIEGALTDLQAEKYAESGTPAYELNNEYFRIGRRKVKVCTEDELFVSLWGSKRVVDSLYCKIIERAEAARVPISTSNFDARAEYGFPPKIDDFFGEVEPADSHYHKGWDYTLWVEEWAEAYLGSGQFASLEERFASTPGVYKATHMDREVFLIRASLDPGRLRELLWQHFVEAAKVGVKDNT